MPFASIIRHKYQSYPTAFVITYAVLLSKIKGTLMSPKSDYQVAYFLIKNIRRCSCGATHAIPQCRVYAFKMLLMLKEEKREKRKKKESKGLQESKINDIK